MEQTTAGGAVTNGLLTVELITGQRQFGDNLFTTYPPAAIPIVGDPTNTFPTYASLSASVFPNKVAQSAQPIGTVYSADGTLTTSSQRPPCPVRPSARSRAIRAASMGTMCRSPSGPTSAPCPCRGRRRWATRSRRPSGSR